MMQNKADQRLTSKTVVRAQRVTGKSQVRRLPVAASNKAKAPAKVVVKEPEVEEIKVEEVPKTAAQLAMERMDRLLAASAQA